MTFEEMLVSLMPRYLQDEYVELSSRGVVFAVVVIIIAILITIALYVIAFFIAMKLNKRIFKTIKHKHGNSITSQFMEKTIALVIIIVLVVLPLGGEMLQQSLLGSTAVIAAVVGLAANDVIKDMFAGLQISIYKPFDIGSRIMLEDGRAGIVDSVTLRHVVISLLDSTKLIVPNSKINSMNIVNYSYKEEVPRAFDIRYAISYDSDIEKAKEIIRTTICKCPLTLNSDKYDESDPKSRSVYFLELTDNAIILGATVYYASDNRTEVVKDEVNTEIFKSLCNN